MSSPFERGVLPSVGDVIKLDITNTTLAAMLKGLEERGIPFNFSQSFTVQDVGPEGISLLAEDEDFEVTIPFEYYLPAGHTLQ